MEDALRAGAGDDDLRLIETMLWDGSKAPRAALHLERLADGARALGWPLPEIALTGPPAPARLRLTYDRLGRAEITHSPLPATAALWQVGIAHERLRSDDPWLRLKSTRRAAYDAARRTLAPGLDEVIFLNERGEVCDGTITTVFFDRGDGMRTPPLRSGLLPGVLRRALACPEEVLMAADLPDVTLWVGNALRGLIPARLHEPNCP